MAVPNPPKALDGHCSTVWNSTLYVLSSNSFQSVALKQGAQWSQETLGKAVAGAACAKVQQGSDASSAQLYVIGGTTSDSSYSGLQRYTFSSKTWETLPAPVTDMQNRLNHSAIYMPSDNKILVYAGSPASSPAWLSSQTFTILAAAPYTIDSFVNRGHTANNPILDTWNATHVLMTGGSSIDATNYLFDTTNGWDRYGTSLTAPIMPGVRGVVIQGTDGSKVLQTFDASVSPNLVSNILLQNADGSPASIGNLLGATKRDLTVSNWPAYNATNAPSTIRSDYSVATDGQGLAIIVGGNNNNPLDIFNQNNNGWVNAAKYFNSDPSQVPLVTSSAASASATATSGSATATSSAAQTSDTAAVGSVPATIVDDAAARQSQQLRTQLGIVLGICGAIFLFFLLILLWLRARKRKQERGVSYGGNQEGGRMSFADRGASFMKEAEGSKQNNNNFYPTADRYSVSQRMSPFDSTTNLGNNGKRGVSGGAYKGYTGHRQKGSYESTKELVEKDGYVAEPVEMTPVHGKKALSPMIRKPAPAYHVERATEIPAAGGMMLSAVDNEKDRSKRSSGWSRYFATSQPAENGAHLPSAYRKDGVIDVKQTPKDPAYTSVYSQAPPSLPAVPSHLPSTGLMPPLNIDFTTTLDGQRLSKVASSSPSYNNSQENVAAAPAAAKIEHGERPPSAQTMASSFDDHATISSNAHSDFYNHRGPQEAWTPMTMATSFKDHVNDTSDPNSRTSSIYTASVYGERPRSRGRSQVSSFFPGAGTLAAQKGSRIRSNYSAAPSADWGSLENENMDSFRDAMKNRDTVHSNVTVFPEPMPDGAYTATTRQLSQKSAKSTTNATGSGMAGLEKGSNMTLFPRTVEIKHFPGTAKATEIPGIMKNGTNKNHDVSWVNLEAK